MAGIRDTIPFVFNAPSILVAGNETLYLDLSERLPKSCRVYYCETIGETLDRAVDATVVLVDESISGGGGELCRRLRTDPMTAGIPLVLLSAGPTEPPVADQVAAPEIDATLDVLRGYLPGLKVSGVARAVGQTTGQHARYFDLDSSTVSWRPGNANDAWPPPPPPLEQSADMLQYTQALAGYVNSLVEAHEKPEGLNPYQLTRMQEVSEAVLGAMDTVLNEAQQAVNAALREKNLVRMRELSASKTALFERLQRLRAVLRQSGIAVARPPASADEPASLGTTGPRARPATSGTVADSTRPLPGADRLATTRKDDGGPDKLGTTGPLPSSHTGAGGAVKPVKSQLTIAAEKKDRERKHAGRDQGTDPQPRQSPAGTRPPLRRPTTTRRGQARKAPSEPRSPRLILVVGAIAIAGIIWYALSGHKPAETSARPKTNAPPTMKYVTIQQTPAGIIARPLAEDPEGDRVVYSIRWFVNGSLVDNARTARLSPDNYRAGMLVQVEVTPTDSFGQGQPMRSQELKIVQLQPTAGRTPLARPR